MLGNVREMNILKGVERVNGKEFVTLTEKETGIIIDQFWNVRMKNPPGRPPKGAKAANDFCKIYMRNWTDVVRRKKLTLLEAGLFAMLIAFVDWESNYLVHPETGENMSGRDIAKSLDMDLPSVQEYLDRLNEKGLIAVVKLGRGRPNHYILNSNLVFRGRKMKNLREHDRFRDSPLELPIFIDYQELERR